jgi:hypothetical protein
MPKIKCKAWGFHTGSSYRVSWNVMSLRQVDTKDSEELDSSFLLSRMSVPIYQNNLYIVPEDSSLIPTY